MRRRSIEDSGGKAKPAKAKREAAEPAATKPRRRPLGSSKRGYAPCSCDMQELVDAGAIADRDYAAWDAFHADLVRWFLENPASADAVFRAIWRHRAPSSAIEDDVPPDNVVELSGRRGSRR